MAKVRKRGKSYQIDYVDPDGKRVRMSFRKRKDAEAELGKRVSLIAENRYLDVKKDYRNTFGELLDKYEENFKHQSSWGKYKRFYVENFAEYFGRETRLSNIGYVDLETFRNHLREKLTKNETIRQDASVNREVTTLRHLFNKAVEWEMVERSPFDKGVSLHLKENNKRLRFLSEREITRLLDECRPQYVRQIVECVLHTGMRREELLTLQWAQIREGLIYLQKTKSNKARQIPVNDDLDVLLKGIRKEKQLRSEHVFTDGNHRAVRTIRRPFEGAMRRAGIEDFRFHDLRHTFASHFIMRGGSLKDLQEILGHEDIKTTMRYAHLSQEHKKKAVNLLCGLTAPSESAMSQKRHILPEAESVTR